MQVAEQEREPRELVDRPRDHARRREPVVVAGRVGRVEPLAHAREVAEHEAHDDRRDADRHRSAADARQPRPGGGPHRAGEREHGGRRERRDQREREVVADVRRGADDLDHDRHREVAEVVVVELLAGHPGVVRRERGRGVRGVHERHVHRLLGPPHVGRVGDQQHRRGEGDREHGLRAEPQPQPRGVVGGQRARPDPLRAPARPPALARLAQPCRQRPLPRRGQRAGEGEQRDDDDDRGGAVGDGRDRRQHPHHPRDEQQAERLCEPEPRARQTPEGEPGERDGRQADDLDQQKEPERVEHWRGC